jgi:Prasinovirus endonuclease VII
MPFNTKEEKRLYDKSRYRANPQPVKERVKIWRKVNPERRKEQRRVEWQRHYSKNAERLKNRVKEYYRQNANERRAYSKKWRAANPERVKATKKAYLMANVEKVKAYRTVYDKRYRQEKGKVLRQRKKEYAEANRAKINLYRKAYYEVNPMQKLALNYRRMLYKKLKSHNVRKSGKAVSLLGCDMQWLVAWLEVQFRPEMSWENYGSVWHVDHIKPCVRFELSDPAQQRLCFHWTNLQPLFAEENLSKGSKWEISQEAA